MMRETEMSEQTGRHTVVSDSGAEVTVLSTPEALASFLAEVNEQAASEPAWPSAGAGATLHFWTDSHAYTVTAVSASGKTVTMQRDKAQLDPAFQPDFHSGGFAGHVANSRDQRYTYQPDPAGTVRKARLTKSGWKSSGQRVTPGRHEFYDHNF
jgi:hypothetical protein